jgi:hypothetical protein
MAYTTPLYGTGYEMGAVPQITINKSLATINSNVTYVKTGTYSLRLQGDTYVNAWVKTPVPVTTSTLYVSCQIHTGGNYPSLGVILDSGEVVEIRKSPTNYTWDLYVGGSLVEAGSIVTLDSQFQQLQVYFNIDNSGQVTTKIDGVEDIDYSGDVQPGVGNTIAYVQQFQRLGFIISYWDDFSFGLGDWGGDIRFDALVPNGDYSVQWTPSTGVNNYALVDERPPSTVDYVSTGSPGLEDLYDLADWSGTAKTPQFVMAWAYAKKDVAGDIQLQLFVDSNGNESSGGSLDLSTSDVYYSHLAATDPDGSIAWLDNAIDALKIGIRSV